MDELQKKIDNLLESKQADNVTVVVNLLMDAYYIQIFRLAMSILQNEDDAEDVAQETIVTAVRNIHRYQTGTNLKAWLFTMTVNKCRDNFRKSRRQQNYLLEWHNNIKTTTNVTTPEDITLHTETRQEIWKVVNGLNEKHRIPIILRFVHNLPVREISQILDCSEGTVHSRLHYAEKKLFHLFKSNKQLMKDIVEVEI